MCHATPDARCLEPRHVALNVKNRGFNVHFQWTPKPRWADASKEIRCLQGPFGVAIGTSSLEACRDDFDLHGPDATPRFELMPPTALQGAADHLKRRRFRVVGSAHGQLFDRRGIMQTWSRVEIHASNRDSVDGDRVFRIAREPETALSRGFLWEANRS